MLMETSNHLNCKTWKDWMTSLTCNSHERSYLKQKNGQGVGKT